MNAPGETDLATLLRDLHVARRPGTYCYVGLDADAQVPANAVLVLDEGTTRCAVVPATPGGTFECVWLTLTVHSSLEAVGLTAAFAAPLATAGISANVVAGLHHDHVLVPVDRADDAIAVLSSLGRP